MTSLLLLLACPKKEEAPPPPPAAEPTPPPPLPAWAEAVFQDMDRTADPCQDFYRYACGGWMDRFEMPADKSRYTRSFNFIADNNRELIHQILEEAATKPDAKADPDWKRIGTYYKSCMDESAVEAAGLTPIAPLLSSVDGLKDKKGLMKVVGELNSAGVSPFFSSYVDGDFKDPQLTILHLGQGGLGLPDRDYYLGTDDESVALVKDYEAYVAQVLVLGGAKPEVAAKDAAAIVAFEKSLALIHKPRAELRDPQATYNRLERAGLEKKVPELKWGDWLTAIGGPAITTINVEVPDVFAAEGKLVSKTDLKVLKAYMRFHVLNTFAPSLGKSFVDTSFAFNGVKVQGQKEIEPRWKRCVRSTDTALGEAVGKFFVEQRFAGESKPKAQQMITDIQDAFAANLPGLEWMDEATRAKALEKKGTLANMIGYPDTWRDYSAMALGDAYAGNLLSSIKFEHQDQVGRVGKPTDPKRWLMSPATVNAYYHPLYNHMVFPAGILQPPFYDASYPLAMNYGAIGMVMGHELSHGFDDQGAQFDPYGRMVEWWAPEATAKFKERTQCVVDQYNAYTVGDLHVNGELTLGENIADLGGVKTAYTALTTRLAADPSQRANLQELTDEQLFFVAMAQGWCTEATPQWEKNQVITDPHSPARWRVNGPLADSPDFAKAFNCPVGTPMHPEKPCEVW